MENGVLSTWKDIFVVLDVRGGNTTQKSTIWKLGNPHFITIHTNPSLNTTSDANGHYVMEKNSIFSYKLPMMVNL